MIRSIFISILFACISGCATTNTGEAFLLYDDDKVLESIPYFEKGVEEGARISALMLAMIYARDTYIPQDITLAQRYYDQYNDMTRSLYDNTLDYFQPFVQATIWLNDDDLGNDVKANKILRSGQYRTFSPVLLTLGKNYAKGIGTKKNYRLSHELYRQAVEYQESVFVELNYAWTLATHEDSVYRTTDPLTLIPNLDDVEEDLDFVYYDVLAAVLARQGKYVEAVAKQEVAIQRISRKLAVYPHYQEWLGEYQERKKSYEANESWIDID